MGRLYCYGKNPHHAQVRSQNGETNRAVFSNHEEEQKTEATKASVKHGIQESNNILFSTLREKHFASGISVGSDRLNRTKYCTNQN